VPFIGFDGVYLLQVSEFLGKVPAAMVLLLILNIGFDFWNL
jgi:hypothetical protein